MKKLLVLLFAVALSGCCPLVAQCPVKGDKDNPKFQALDSLKNRSLPADQVTVMDIWVLFSPNIDDRQSFTTDMYVQTTGYIKLVKRGGAETCNCHSKDKDDEDYHIEVVPDDIYSGEPMICEVNRFARCIDYDDLKDLVGHKVVITGWLFFDSEHWSNAVHTNPKGTNNWRVTAWEIHPVLSIKLAE